MSKFQMIAAAGVVSGILLSGCATMDRAYEATSGWANPDSTTLKSNVKWMSPPSQLGLRPVSADDMVVYLRYKNSSGSDLPNLYSDIRSSLQAAGYRITSDPDQAHFYLVADVYHFGQGKAPKGVGGIATGAAAGGATGAVIGHNVGSGHAGTGAAAGAVVGAGVANVMANRNPVREINLIVDLKIGERVQGGVKTVRKAETGSGVVHSDRAATQASRSQASSSSTQRIEVQDDFLMHTNRLVAQARRMNLNPEEAFPVLSRKLTAAISSALP